MRWRHISRSSPPRPDGLVSTLSGKPITRSGFGHKWRATVQARLGHASAVETLDTYSHLWPDSDDRTRDAIDSALGSTADEGGSE